MNFSKMFWSAKNTLYVSLLLKADILDFFQSIIFNILYSFVS